MIAVEKYKLNEQVKLAKPIDNNVPKLHGNKPVKKKPRPPTTHRQEMERKELIVTVPISSNNDLKASWTP